MRPSENIWKTMSKTENKKCQAILKVDEALTIYG